MSQEVWDNTEVKEVHILFLCLPIYAAIYIIYDIIFLI